MLRGKLDDDGFFRGDVTFEHRPIREIALKLGGKSERPWCGSFVVEIRAGDRDQDSLAPVVEETSLSLAQVRRTLTEFSGVSLYRDGFRVHPYSERGDDWLNLDSRSRQNPPMHLANNQVVAAIRISRNANPDLKDRSTREGLVYNDAYRHLTRWFVEILHLLENDRYKLRPRKDTPESYVQPLFEAFDLSPVLAATKRALGTDHAVYRLLAETETRIEGGVTRVQETFSRLLLTAGIGQMVDVAIHEIGRPLGKCNLQVASLKKQLQGLLEGQQLANAMKHIEALQEALDQILLLRQRLDPQAADKRGRAVTFDVYEAVRDTFHLFEAALHRQGIQWEISNSSDAITAKMSRAALDQIIGNLIDNSIYCLIREHGAGEGGSITAEICAITGGFRLRFVDDGPGIPDEDLPHIFDSYFSRKSRGVGLGLHIARLVMEPYGKIVCDSTRRDSGACFVATFERNVGR